MLAALVFGLAVALPPPVVVRMPSFHRTVARGKVPVRSPLARGEYVTELRMAGDVATMDAMARRRYAASQLWSNDRVKIAVPLRTHRY